MIDLKTTEVGSLVVPAGNSCTHGEVIEIEGDSVLVAWDYGQTTYEFPSDLKNAVKAS